MMIIDDLAATCPHCGRKILIRDFGGVIPSGVFFDIPKSIKDILLPELAQRRKADGGCPVEEI